MTRSPLVPDPRPATLGPSLVLPGPLSRRGFLRTSAVVAAQPWLLRRPQEESAPVTPALSRDDAGAVRIGLIGCGGRGTGAAYQALNAEDGSVVLVAMADVFPDKIEASHANLTAALGGRADRVQVDADHRFTGFDAYRKLLATGVDVVLLTTPPHFRPAMLEAAIAAGKHVFCEKPVAVDGPGIRSVLASVEAARAKKLSLVCGFCWRYNVRHRSLYERVHDGALGDIRAVYSTYLTSPNAQVERQEGWTDLEWHLRNWYHVNWLSGDHVVEQACHSLDKMAWAMGDVAPLRVTAVGGRQAKEGPASGNNYDHFAATFEYPNGVLGFHTCRQMESCANDNSDWILGTKGNAFINGWAPIHEITGENAWVYEGEDNDMYQQEHDELFASIRAGKPRNDGTWMAHSTLLGIMARMAAYTGQVVSWEQAMGSEQRLGPEVHEPDRYAMGPCELESPAIPGRTKLF